MALPATGVIRLSDIAAEFGGAVPHQLSEYYAGGTYVPSGTTGLNGPIPSSGMLKFSDFYGAPYDGLFNPYSYVNGQPDISYSGGFGVAFSNDGTYLSVVHSNSPFIAIYKRSGDTFTKLPNPSVLPPSRSQGVAFSNDGTYLSVAHRVSPYITVYKRSGDTFTKLPNPSNLPTGNGNGITFSNDGTYLSVVHNTSPFITVYKRSGDTFAKLPDPDVLPTGNSNGVAFSTDGTYLSVAHATSPFVTIYKRSGDTFTKLPDPDVLPTGNSNGVAFSTDGTYLSVTNVGSSPTVTIYKRSGDTFTKLPNPDVLPTGAGYGVAWSTDGTYMSVAHNVSPFINIYERSGDTFTKLPDPDVLPTNSGQGVAFSNDGTYIGVVYNGNPSSLNIYKNTDIIPFQTHYEYTVTDTDYVVFAGDDFDASAVESLPMVEVIRVPAGYSVDITNDFIITDNTLEPLQSVNSLEGSWGQGNVVHYLKMDGTGPTESNTVSEGQPLEFIAPTVYWRSPSEIVTFTNTNAVVFGFEVNTNLKFSVDLSTP